MISKPNNYETIIIGGERLEPGGHKCLIKQVTEQVSQKGSQMLVVAFDTDQTDAQPFFYQNRFLSDTRLDKKWGGNMYLVVDGEYGPTNLKRFCTAVENSNEGFSCWGADGFLRIAELAGKRVGICFRLEEYISPVDQTVRAAVKPFYFCSFDKASEQAIPERKNLPNSSADPTKTVPPVTWFTPAPAQQPFPQPDYGFVNVPADSPDEGLPFQ